MIWGPSVLKLGFRPLQRPHQIGNYISGDSLHVTLVEFKAINMQQLNITKLIIIIATQFTMNFNRTPAAHPLGSPSSLVVTPSDHRRQNDLVGNRTAERWSQYSNQQLGGYSIVTPLIKAAVDEAPLTEFAL